MTTALLCDHVLQSLHTYVLVVEEPPTPPPEASDVDTARWRLYRRLRPMLHGEHHLEEIVWQERLARDTLHDLLRAYDSYLVSIVTIDDGLGAGLPGSSRNS